MNARHVLVLFSAAIVLALAQLSVISGCGRSNVPPQDRKRALELVREAERTMHWAGGIAEFWLPWEVLMEEANDEAPQDRAEFETILREAIALLKQALELDPDLHRARFDIAVIHLRLGEVEPAEAWAKGFLKEKPNDPQGLELLSVVYLGAEKWRELADLCKAAIPVLEAGEEEADVVLDPGYFFNMAATALFHMGELAEAREWAEAAIEADDEDPQGYRVLAVVQHVAGDAEGLAETRAILKELDPEAEQELDGIFEAWEKEGLGKLLP